jgi:arylsulfatase A-like enzyme
MMKNISRRRFIKNSAGTSTALLLASCARGKTSGADTVKSRPNILFVFPDEFRKQAMGFLGEDPVITPALDGFAQQGMVFTNACSSYPVCSPFRAMLMTGKYPLSNGVYGNCFTGTADKGIALRVSDRCFSDVLHDGGYATGYIGKWHLDTPVEENAPYTEGYRKWDGNIWDAYTPPGPRRHGFEFWHSYGCCDNHLAPHYWHGDAPVEERIDVKGWSVEHETNVAIDYIQNKTGEHRDRKKPFALFISWNPPHPPYHMVPEKYLEYYKDKTPEELLNRGNVDLSRKSMKTQAARGAVKQYFAAVTGVDEQFGRLLSCLKEEGLEDNTIVVFTSDHGEMMGSHDRMQKSVWYEESFGIPFIIRWPGKIPVRRETMPLGVTDFMPSILALAGLGEMVPQDVEGSDYSGVMAGTSAERGKSAYYVVPSLNPGPQTGARAVRTERYLFGVMRNQRGERFTLFDLETDPYQLKNIAGKDPALEAELTAELNRWLAKTKDPWGKVPLS